MSSSRCRGIIANKAITHNRFHTLLRTSNDDDHYSDDDDVQLLSEAFFRMFVLSMKVAWHYTKAIVAAFFVCGESFMVVA